MNTRIIEIREERRKLWLEEQDIIENCDHDYQPEHEPYDPTDIWFSDGIKCTKCGHDPGGWYCHTSPNKQCKYERWSCVYCDLPSERK